MSLAANLVLAIVLLVAGFAGGIKWHVGIVAERDLEAQQARESDAKAQLKALDKAAVQHATTLATLNDKLGDAREKIARLSGRACLSGDTVGVLNSTGTLSSAAPAGEPASAPATAATGAGLRFATERDVAGYIAICRTRYGEVADQLNQILDIEDRRWPR